MRVLYLGDIVGRPARDKVAEMLPGLRDRLAIDFVIANGENAAGGFGLTPAVAEGLFEAGIDCLSGGNHTFDMAEVIPLLETDKRVLRPLNYPPGTPGRGTGLYEDRKGRRILVVNAMGRVFMEAIDDPFRAVDEVLRKYPMGPDTQCIVLDFHGEATSEKMAMGHFADGRVSMTIGSHVHVPTADAQILPGGSAYQTDAGMCGVYDSVIGMDKEEPLRRFLKKVRGARFQPAKGEVTLCGVLLESDDSSGLAKSIEPLRVGGSLREHIPGGAS